MALFNYFRHMLRELHNERARRQNPPPPRPAAAQPAQKPKEETAPAAGSKVRR